MATKSLATKTKPRLAQTRKAMVNMMITEDHRESIAQPFMEPFRKKTQQLEGDLLKANQKIVGLEQEKMISKETVGNLNQELASKNQILENVVGELQMLKAPVHPTYGRLLTHSGNRRVFAAKPKKLCNKELFPTYLAQRSFRPERADAIAESMRKDDRFHGFPGVISMFELYGEAAAATRGHQVRGIVDGQHRIGAIERLLQTQQWPEDREVIIEVYSISDPADAGRLFRQINKSQPVFDIDLVPVDTSIAENSESVAPAAISEEQQKERAILKEQNRVKTVIDNVTSNLQQMYPEMFKPSQKCRPPHVNVDVLRQALFESGEARKALQSEERLLEFVMQKNDELQKQKYAPSAALDKAKSYGFFLGMVKTWC